MNNQNLMLLLTVIFIGFLMFIPLIFSSHKPQTIVYIPSGASLPVPAKDAKTITGDKAVLWYTVYEKTMDKGWNCNDAKNCADDAVETVYGK